MNGDNYQLLRWGIPGWCFIFFIFLFFLSNHYFSGSNPEAVESFLSIFSDDRNSVFITIIIGSSIPIGFLFYQVHHYLWWVLFSPSSEWVIDIGIMPPSLFENDINSFLLEKMINNSDEQKRIEFWAKVLTYVGYFPLPHLSLGTFSKQTRLNKRMEVLNEARVNRHKWELVQAIWHEGNPDDNQVHRNNYLFGALGTITFSVGGAFVVFLMIKMLDWIWRYETFANVLIYCTATILVALATSFLFTFIRKLAMKIGLNVVNMGNQTTGILIFGALFLGANYYLLGLLYVYLEGKDYPIHFGDTVSLAIAFIITGVLISACRGNRRDLIKGRNLLLAYNLHLDD